MKLFIDIDQQKPVESLLYRRPIEQIDVRRGTTLDLEVQFVSKGALVDIGAPNLVLAVKSLNEFDQDPPLFLSNTFVKTGSGLTAVWESSVVISSAAVDTALAVDGNESNDVAEFVVMAEFSWSLTGSRYATARFNLCIENNIYREDDSVPPIAAVAGEFLYLDTVTAILGAGGLDEVPTQLMLPPTLVSIVVAGVYSLWILRTQTTEVEDGEGYVIPNDFDIGTNRKVWVRLG